MNNENAEDDVPANHDGQGYMHDSIKDQHMPPLELTKIVNCSLKMMVPKY